MNKVQIKIGDTEFGAEGDSDFIARERQQFLQHISGLLYQSTKASDPVVAKDILTDRDAFEPIMKKKESGQDTNVNSLSNFLEKKKFDNAVETVMGVAYYLTYMEQIVLLHGISLTR